MAYDFSPFENHSFVKSETWDIFALLAQKVDHQFRVMSQCLSFSFEGIHHVERVTYKNEVVRYGTVRYGTVQYRFGIGTNEMVQYFNGTVNSTLLHFCLTKQSNNGPDSPNEMVVQIFQNYFAK